MRGARQLLLAVVLAAGTLSLSATSSRPQQVSPGDQAPSVGFIGGVCRVSEPVKDRPPDDPHASSFVSPGATWYANSGRGIWAWWWGKTSDGSYKVLWVRPASSKLAVTGHRLDGDAPPLRAEIPGGYQYTFQASGLWFSAPGCWQVDARADGSTLSFVVRIP